MPLDIAEKDVILRQRDAMMARALGRECDARSRRSDPAQTSRSVRQ
ncbi:MAG TPA: hypothetical protein VLD17_04280 [Gemmatimonadaceae bacterium]|nr:hypothetical protein [Gemmatimonadaceae bacterium]